MTTVWTLEYKKKRVEAEQRARGIANPFPRAECPRCGSWVAVLRDLSRTHTHCCVYPELGDDFPYAVSVKMTDGSIYESRARRGRE